MSKRRLNLEILDNGPIALFKGRQFYSRGKNEGKVIPEVWISM